MKIMNPFIFNMNFTEFCPVIEEEKNIYQICKVQIPDILSKL